MTTTTSRRLTTDHGEVEVTVTERGAGHPVLLLHGGAGPASVEGFADLLAAGRPARVITPTHPGFAGTPRPEWLDDIRGLAAVYTRLLEELEVSDVTVVGNSIGGWLAAEMALLASPRISSVVLVDAVGLTSSSHPIVDFFSLTIDEVTELSYADPDRFRTDVHALPEAARRAMVGNREALLAYGGRSMSDETLRERLPRIALPTLVVWGAHDGVVQPAHGETYAAAIPGAILDVIEDAGHLPQLETPERLLADVWEFADAHATERPPVR